MHDVLLPLSTLSWCTSVVLFLSKECEYSTTGYDLMKVLVRYSSYKSSFVNHESTFDQTNKTSPSYLVTSMDAQNVQYKQIKRTRSKKIIIWINKDKMSHIAMNGEIIQSHFKLWHFILPLTLSSVLFVLIDRQNTKRTF